MQARHAVAKFREAFFGEGKINPIVHPVAGDHDIGFRLCKDAREPFVEIGPGKFSAGVPRFGQAGDGFAGETEVDDFALPAGRARADDGLDEIDVGSGVGNTVAEEDDPLGRGERCREPAFLVSAGEWLRLGGERGQRRHEKKKKAHSGSVKRWDSAERSIHEGRRRLRVPGTRATSQKSPRGPSLV